MNMIAVMVDNSDRTDGGDVGCEDVELVLRDLLPPLAVVVVDQPPPNKVPSQVLPITMAIDLITFTHVIR